MGRLRRKIYLYLDTQAWQGAGLSPINRFLTLLILFSISIVILETESTVYEPYSRVFDIMDLIIVSIFSVEYILRLWIAGENPKYRGVVGRLGYALTPAALIDLVAILPFILGIGGNDVFLMRAFRLLRIFALAKIGRFSQALRELGAAISRRRYELFVSLGLSLFVLLLASSVMYFVESEAQPEAFGSIPRALWWAMATLTTVGYGDVFPITPLGKMFAGVTALAAVGLIAMPTAVLAAAFSDAFQGRASVSDDGLVQRD